MATIVYLRRVSTLSRRPNDTPCPDHGVILRVLYGFFHTRLAEMVRVIPSNLRPHIHATLPITPPEPRDAQWPTLAAAAQLLGYMLHTKANEPQAEQIGGTIATTIGPSRLRIKIVPILGAAFGGNYAYVIWDEQDEQRRAICVDPADPHPVLRAAKEEGLTIVMVLCTHWHFDHSGGNRTLARLLPGLKVVAGAAEKAPVPALNAPMADLEETRVGAAHCGREAGQRAR